MEIWIQLILESLFKGNKYIKGKFKNNLFKCSERIIERYTSFVEKKAVPLDSILEIIYEIKKILNVDKCQFVKIDLKSIFNHKSISIKLYLLNLIDHGMPCVYTM